MSKQFILVLTLSLAGGSAFADSIQDVDNDGQVSKDEFYGFVTDAGIYPDHDLDGDGFIEAREFDGDNLGWDYDAWDLNDDTYLDANEYYTGFYSEYDENEDGHWDGTEWDDAGDAGWFDV